MPAKARPDSLRHKAPSDRHDSASQTPATRTPLRRTESDASLCKPSSNRCRLLGTRDRVLAFIHASHRPFRSESPHRRRRCHQQATDTGCRGGPGRDAWEPVWSADSWGPPLGRPTPGPCTALAGGVHSRHRIRRPVKGTSRRMRATPPRRSTSLAPAAWRAAHGCWSRPR